MCESFCGPLYDSSGDRAKDLKTVKVVNNVYTSRSTFKNCAKWCHQHANNLCTCNALNIHIVFKIIYFKYFPINYVVISIGLFIFWKFSREKKVSLPTVDFASDIAAK